MPAANDPAQVLQFKPKSIKVELCAFQRAPKCVQVLSPSRCEQRRHRSAQMRSSSSRKSLRRRNNRRAANDPAQSPRAKKKARMKATKPPAGPTNFSAAPIIVGPARTHFSQVNYAMFPKVAGRPKVLSKFSILTGLVRLILAHPIYAVPLKGSSYAVPLKGSSSYSQVNIAFTSHTSEAKYGAVPPGSGSPFLLFWGGFGAVPPGSGSPFLLFRGGYYKNYVLCRVLFSLAALFFLDPDRTAALGRWSKEIYRSNYLNIKGLPKVMSKNPFLMTQIAISLAPRETPSVPAKLPGCRAPLSLKWHQIQF